MSEPFDLTDRVALVTGASRGLGQHFAHVLAKAAPNLVVTSRTAASLEPLIKEISDMGRDIVGVELDVRELARAFIGRLPRRSASFIGSTSS